MSDEQDFTDWKFEAPNRELLLERRVKELELTVARLERELRATKQLPSEYDPHKPTRYPTIGAIAGIIGGMTPKPTSKQMYDDSDIGGEA